MDRKNFFHGQAVQYGDLNGAFDQVVKRFRDFFVDTGSNGVAKTPYRSGTAEMTVIEASTPNMTTQVLKGAGYTREGDRVDNQTTSIVNCAIDKDGNATIPSSGNQRWLSVFAKQTFDTNDPRLDPVNSGTVNFNKDAIAAFEVVAGVEAASNPTRPSLRDDATLLADIIITSATTQIINAMIDTTRKDLFTLRSTIMQPDYALQMPLNFGGSSVVPVNTQIFREAFPLAWALFDATPGTNPSNPFTLKSSYNIVKVERLVAGAYKIFVPPDLFASEDDALLLAIHSGSFGGVECDGLTFSAPDALFTVGTWAGDPPAAVEPDLVGVVIFGRPNI